MTANLDALSSEAPKTSESHQTALPPSTYSEEDLVAESPHPTNIPWNNPSPTAQGPQLLKRHRVRWLFGNLSVLLLILSIFLLGSFKILVHPWVGLILGGPIYILSGGLAVWTIGRALWLGGSYTSFFQGVLVITVLVTQQTLMLVPQWVSSRSRSHVCPRLQPFITEYFEDLRLRIRDELTGPHQPAFERARQTKDQARFLADWRARFAKVDWADAIIHEHSIKRVLHLSAQLHFRLNAWADTIASTGASPFAPMTNHVRAPQRELVNILMNTRNRCREVRTQTTAPLHINMGGTDRYLY